MKLKHAIPVTTSQAIQGFKIVAYLGPVRGAAAPGMSFEKDWFTSLRDSWGGRARSLEKVTLSGIDHSEADMVEQALKVGADAVIGVSYVPYTYAMERTSILATACIGTAVKLAKG